MIAIGNSLVTYHISSIYSRKLPQFVTTASFFSLLMLMVIKLYEHLVIISCSSVRKFSSQKTVTNFIIVSVSPFPISCWKFHFWLSFNIEEEERESNNKHLYTHTFTSDILKDFSPSLELFQKVFKFTRQQ